MSIKMSTKRMMAVELKIKKSQLVGDLIARVADRIL